VTVDIPDELLGSPDVSTTAKLVAGMLAAEPLLAVKSVATRLGLSRSAVFRALAQLKDSGIEVCRVNATDESRQCDYSRVNATPHPSKVVCKGGGQSPDSPTSTPDDTKPPTKEEVGFYAAGKGRSDLLEDFFDRYERDGWMVKGEPMTSWRRMFDGWARKRPKPQPAAKRVPTLEEHLYEVDKSY